MEDLTQLAKKYGADKAGKHHYTDFYSQIIGDPMLVRKIVEIGTGEGASLKMWKDFFTNAHIYGVDIDPTRVKEEIERTTILQCDQSNKDELIALVNKTGTDVDFWIDDGSHKPEDQVQTALTVMPLLKKDSIYVIEDVADPHIISELVQPEFNVIQMVKLGKRYDDRLIIISKI